MSNGVIAFRFRPSADEDPTDEHREVPPRGPRGYITEYLMINRQNTLGFIDFVRGKYNLSSHLYILQMLRQMTQHEKYLLQTEKFQTLWDKIWNGTSTEPAPPPPAAPDEPAAADVDDDKAEHDRGGHESSSSPPSSSPPFPQMNRFRKNYDDEENISREKFRCLCRGVSIDFNLSAAATTTTAATTTATTAAAAVPPFWKSATPESNAVTYDLASLIQYSRLTDPLWTEAEWGFPKGRRENGEADYNCAIREFAEETGYATTCLRKIRNIVPYEEIFTGSNYKSYKHKYYLMFMNYEDSLLERSTFSRNNEINAIQWKSFDECLACIREYNFEKKEILAQINQYIRHFDLHEVQPS